MRTDSVNQPQDTLSLFQGPLHELMELNMKTIQNLSYIKPDDFSNLRNPQDIFEKHVNVFIDNSRKSLDYIQKATEILEKNLFLGSNKLRENSENLMRRVKSSTEEQLRKTSR